MSSADYLVDQSSDDADEARLGPATVNISNLYVRVQSTVVSPFWGGLRFRTGTFPAKGSIITAAYLEVYTYDLNFDDANLDIYAEDGASPATFVVIDGNISGRALTDASTEWAGLGLGLGWKQSPSIVNIIQELVDSYNVTAIALVLKSKGSWPVGTAVLRFRSWDEASHILGAKLHLEWTGATPPEPSEPPETPEEEIAEAAAPPYEVLLYSRGVSPIAGLYPLETGDCNAVQPISICWTRCWQEAGTFELVLPARTPYLSDLMSLGSYIVIRRADTGAFEAIYIIEHAELQTGIVTYVLDSVENINAVYAAGQDTGTLRDLVVRVDNDSITAMGSRLEMFLDARDVEKDNLALLIQRADAQLGEIKPVGSLVAKAGQPVQDEIITVSGRSLLFWCAKRVVLPPPGTEGAGNIVDITGADYDEQTDTADAVMRDYVTNHLIAPLDPARVVNNFVLGAAGAPLANITFQGRFGTVLDTLQEIASLHTCGMEVILNAANQFEFRVVPQVDRTIGGGNPLIFWSGEALLSIPGRSYRNDWDLGDKVTLIVEDLGNLEIDLTIMAITHTLQAEAAPGVGIAFDTPTASDLERFRRAVLAGDSGNIKAARA